VTGQTTMHSRLLGPPLVTMLCLGLLLLAETACAAPESSPGQEEKPDKAESSEGEGSKTQGPAPEQGPPEDPGAEPDPIREDEMQPAEGEAETKPVVREPVKPKVGGRDLRAITEDRKAEPWKEGEPVRVVPDLKRTEDEDGTGDEEQQPSEREAEDEPPNQHGPEG